jgi:hypothetical protein
MNYQRAAALLGTAAIAFGIGVVGLTGPPPEVEAHPSGGTEVTVEPVLKPPTVVQTTAPPAPRVPFATPSVKAPQAGAA